MTHTAYITATAAFLPHAAVNNDAMERLLGQVGAKPSRRAPYDFAQQWHCESALRD